MHQQPALQVLKIGLDLRGGCRSQSNKVQNSLYQDPPYGDYPKSQEFYYFKVSNVHQQVFMWSNAALRGASRPACIATTFLWTYTATPRGKSTEVHQQPKICPITPNMQRSTCIRKISMSYSKNLLMCINKLRCTSCSVLRGASRSFSYHKRP